MFFDFHYSAKATTLSGAPFEWRLADLLMKSEPTDIYSLVPMPSASSITKITKMRKVSQGEEKVVMMYEKEGKRDNLHLVLLLLMVSLSVFTLSF